MLKKFTSRKFLLALITTICGVLSMCNVSDVTIKLISGALMVVVPNVVYIITEGRIDRENIATMFKQLSDTLSDNSENIE